MGKTELSNFIGVEIRGINRFFTAEGAADNQIKYDQESKMGKACLLKKQIRERGRNCMQKNSRITSGKGHW